MHRQLVDNAAVAIEADTSLDADPNRGVLGKPDPAHYREQLFAGADPRTSVAKIASRSLEHRDVPAAAPQQMGCEQPADRSADHQCAWSSQCPLRHFASVMMTVPPSADKRVDAAAAF